MQSNLIKRIVPAATVSSTTIEILPVEQILTKMQSLEQYVKNVIDYTSKYNITFSYYYSPENLIGRYSIYPAYGDFPETYIIRTYGKWWKQCESYQKHYMPQDVDPYQAEDYVTLCFGTAVVPRHVCIYETFNPGAVVRIWGRYSQSKWKLLWEGPPQKCTPDARKFDPPIIKHNCLINEIRLEFNQSHLKYHTSIDAVLLGGFEPSCTLHYNVLQKDLLKFVLETECLDVKDQETELENEKIDIFSTLPFEVILGIFQYLDLKSLSRCARVNKKMYIATLDPILYHNLSLKRYWHIVNTETLKYFRPRCKNLKKLDLSWCGNDNSYEFETEFNLFLNGCKQITHLSLCHCEFIGSKAFRNIMLCKDLVELRLVNVKIDNGRTKFAKLRKLVTLDLSYSNINGPGLIELLKISPNLKHLILDFCEHIITLDEIAEAVSLYNQKLNTWTSFKTSTLSPVGAGYLSKLPNLINLDLGWAFALLHPGDCLERIARNCRLLQRLIISQWRALNDHMLEMVVMHCRDLEQLDISGNKGISTEICEKALKTLDKLKLFDISFCDSVCNESVAKWRFLYPDVTIPEFYRSE